FGCLAHVWGVWFCGKEEDDALAGELRPAGRRGASAMGRFARFVKSVALELVVLEPTVFTPDVVEHAVVERERELSGFARRGGLARHFLVETRVAHHVLEVSEALGPHADVDVG